MVRKTFDGGACAPDFSYLPLVNDVGGRPDERRGTRGSFTAGLRVWRGGTTCDWSPQDDVQPGTVLFEYPGLKPDLSGEARTNIAGGRPDERLGSRGSFTPGGMKWRGGFPRDVPLEADINPGIILHRYSDLKPDMSCEAQTNVVGARPTERMGSRGSFTAGSKVMKGGVRGDIASQTETNHGTVLFTYPSLKPDTSGLPQMNTIGGRPTERLGSRGSFTPGVQIRSGGSARDIPLEATINPGIVLHRNPMLKPDVSGEAKTNVAGGRPTERYGSRGSFTRGVRQWRGGEPRNVPLEPEIDHGTILYRVGGSEDTGSVTLPASADEYTSGVDKTGKPTQEARETIGERLAGSTPKTSMSSTGDLSQLKNESGGVFRRCGSDSQFPPMGGAMSGGPPRYGL